ncbi:MAG: SDR family NAD(P)-dependent oxidoreductase [Kiritimatiellae bacterium]|jgi:NAD(P)-dependent dehydrogenase (short-subunit alcohol dehydrogenase family)|nr:SDR family NAD(P)-dependent oxidoreductase [Kiritimatiellia bacterium]
MKEFTFKDQVAVVTGAGGTLCSVIAKELSERGSKLALLGRSVDKLQPVADEIIAAGGTALVIPTDITDVAAVEKACAEITEELGVCRFLINGAGGNQAVATTSTTVFEKDELFEDKPEEMRGFFDLDMDAVESVIKTNTVGTMLPSQVFGREMARLGRGSILNFASMTSYRPLTRVPAYAAAKAGVINFTQWLSVYLAPAGIRVNAVAPGFFVNDRSRKILMTPDGGLSARGECVMAHTPQREFGEAKDLLGCVCWLLNDDQAKFVTGITVPVDGGFLASTGV